MTNRLRLLIVEDEKIVRESMTDWLEAHGHETETAASGQEALERLEKKQFDLLFADAGIKGMDGLELLDRVTAEYPETRVVIITDGDAVETAIRAVRAGASDCLLRPVNPAQLSLVMEKMGFRKKNSSDRHRRTGHLERTTRFENIIGRSSPMKKLFALIPEVAQSDSSVLITGETGTGKELVAKAVHAKSHRAQLPFIPINCGALPDALMESELFGHAKGAFTGAEHARKGFLEVVSGGTLFLDEIGDTSEKMQVDLLRVLEDKKIFMVGGKTPVDVDFRLISATRQDLEDRIEKGRFREDFFYRINVIRLHLPPLRDRKSDIPLLVEHFMAKYSLETTRHVDRIKPAAMALLRSYDWPGNVRELENAVERAVVLSRSRTLAPDDFSFLAPAPASAGQTLKAVQTNHILRVLTEQDWQITRSAKILGINRVTLHKIIKRDNLKDNRKKR